MARIRTVKPEMAQDEDIAACSIEAQLLAVRILNFADDEGYFKAHPSLVNASCFPLLNLYGSIPGMLRELSGAGYLRLGKGSDGKYYGQVVNFLKHQSINKPYPSKIKDLVTFPECSGSTTGGLPTGMEWNGMEKEQGMEKEKEGSSDASASAAPQAEAVAKFTIPLVDKSEYRITQTLIDDLQQSFPGINAETELLKCRAWNVANPKNRKTPAGVLKHITAWLSRAQDKAPVFREPPDDPRESARRMLFNDEPETIEGEARRVQ